MPCHAMTQPLPLASGCAVSVSGAVNPAAHHFPPSAHSPNRSFSAQGNVGPNRSHLQSAHAQSPGVLPFRPLRRVVQPKLVLMPCSSAAEAACTDPRRQRAVASRNVAASLAAAEAITLAPWARNGGISPACMLAASHTQTASAGRTSAAMPVRTGSASPRPSCRSWQTRRAGRHAAARPGCGSLWSAPERRHRPAARSGGVISS